MADDGDARGEPLRVEVLDNKQPTVKASRPPFLIMLRLFDDDCMKYVLEQNAHIWSRDVETINRAMWFWFQVHFGAHSHKEVMLTEYIGRASIRVTKDEMIKFCFLQNFDIEFFSKEIWQRQKFSTTFEIVTPGSENSVSNVEFAIQNYVFFSDVRFVCDNSRCSVSLRSCHFDGMLSLGGKGANRVFLEGGYADQVDINNLAITDCIHITNMKMNSLRTNFQKLDTTHSMKTVKLSNLDIQNHVELKSLCATAVFMEGIRAQQIEVNFPPCTESVIVNSIQSDEMKLSAPRLKSLKLLRCHFRSFLVRVDRIDQIVLEECRFAIPPDFRDTKLPDHFEFRSVTWCGYPVDVGEAQRHVSHFERLKQEMESRKRHVDEIFFFAHEMRARRSLIGRKNAQWWANYLFDKCSDYGQSIVRPLAFLFLVVFIGFVIHHLTLQPVLDHHLKPSTPQAQAAVGSGQVASGGSSGTGTVASPTSNLFEGRLVSISLLFSLRSTFPFFPIKSHDVDDFATIIEKAPLSALVSIVQTILGALFLFLILLAFKNLFRFR